jgi:hypothetical protein
MAVQLVTAPTVEPLALTDVKPHLRVDTAMTDDDALITAMITAVRMHAESVTRRALCTQSWKMVLDKFPNPAMNIGSANWYGPQWGISPGPLTVVALDGITGNEIFMPLAPLQTLDSLKYIDTDGNLQTMTVATDTIVDNVSEPARVVPAYGTAWPATRNQINAVTLQFTCGYGAAAAVPQAIKNWMLLRIGALYENREEMIVGTRIIVADLPFVDGMLEPYRVVKF